MIIDGFRNQVMTLKSLKQSNQNFIKENKYANEQGKEEYKGQLRLLAGKYQNSALELENGTDFLQERIFLFENILGDVREAL